MRLRRGRLCFRRTLPQHRLPSLPIARLGDHLRRPRAARGFPTLIPYGSRPRRCGCADHHEMADRKDDASHA